MYYIFKQYNQNNIHTFKYFNSIQIIKYSSDTQTLEHSKNIIRIILRYQNIVQILNSQNNTQILECSNNILITFKCSIIRIMLKYSNILNNTHTLEYYNTQIFKQYSNTQQFNVHLLHSKTYKSFNYYIIRINLINFTTTNKVLVIISNIISKIEMKSKHEVNKLDLQNIQLMFRQILT